MKSPDEIKKGLECCTELSGSMCPFCPYAENGYVSDTCREEMAADALALTQQLEAERDAAVADIRLAFTSYVGTCQTCKHGENQVDCIEPLRCGNCENEKCKCQSCDSYDSNWEWRGVQKENRQ